MGTHTTTDAEFAALNEKLQAASNEAVEVVHKYAALDPFEDSVENPWKDPKQIFKQLAIVRDNLNESWQNYQIAFERDQVTKTNQKDDAEDKMPEEEFRAMYMDMITDAFGDILEHMREEEGDKIDVNVLVDCLQSGMEFLEDNEVNRQSYFDSFRDDDDEEEEESLPIHKLRQIKLGYPAVQTTRGQP